MSELVDPSEIESIVGAARHETDHYARAVPAMKRVYILHSRQCVDTNEDLRQCRFSIALDKGIDHPVPRGSWMHLQDRAVKVEILQGFMVPELKAVREAVRESKDQARRAIGGEVRSELL